jgi:translation initiation factor 4A
MEPVADKVESWDSMNIPMNVMRGIHSYGYEKPSPIQCKAIIPIMNGGDVIAQAQSGTGKTGAFTIGLLSKLDYDKKGIQAIVISPTRELSQQTKKVIDSIGTFCNGLSTRLFVGGTSTQDDIRSIKYENPNVIVGCTGRIYDMMERNPRYFENISIVIVDEADDMLSGGFEEQLYNIFKFLQHDTQIVLFSATMPHEISNITSKFMRNPTEILVEAEKLTLEGIHQYYVSLSGDNDKLDTLKDLFGMLTVAQTIIYCNTLEKVELLYGYMRDDGFPVTRLHSGMSRDERTESYESFRSGKQRILISSNVTARGIDIQQVSTVINFDVPKCVHNYLHRIGRSGRWGRKGTAINFITKYDSRYIRDIERHYSTEIKELPIDWDKYVS